MRLNRSGFQPAPEPPRLTFRRLVFYLLAILAGLAILRLMDMQVIRSPFAAKPTATRSGTSYAQEGQAFFDSGNLEQSILAYRNAVVVDPESAELWADLARVQTYSSALIIANDSKKKRLEEARASITKAVELDPEFGFGYAVQTLVLDWSADPNLVDDVTLETYLEDAYRSSIKAQQLLPNDPLTMALQAEVLADQANQAQALEFGRKAAESAPGIMDVRRAYAYVLERNASYTQAIDEYRAAISINYNLPFLHMRLGANYRKIGESTTDPNVADTMIENALEEFAIASTLNPKDPGPFLSIANTYANQGEFFIAERNAQKALSLDPTNATIYGRLGAIYYKAKNYEGAQIILRCAVRGCRAAENEEEGVDVVGIPLALNSLDFYYYYGSVSAFFGQCDEAASIYAELRASPWMEPFVEEIIQEGERICASYTRKTQTASP
jgi:tetratricopeptide (TPR) repeat protein